MRAVDAEFDDTYHTKHVNTIFRRVFDQTFGTGRG
jgi:hypothetical protein